MSIYSEKGKLVNEKTVAHMILARFSKGYKATSTQHLRSKNVFSSQFHGPAVDKFDIGNKTRET